MFDEVYEYACQCLVVLWRVIVAHGLEPGMVRGHYFAGLGSF